MLPELIASHFEKADFSKAIIEIRKIADEANKYFDKYEPWKLIEEDQGETKEVLDHLKSVPDNGYLLKPILLPMWQRLKPCSKKGLHLGRRSKNGGKSWYLSI